MVTGKTAELRAQRRWADARGVRYDAFGCVRVLADNLREPLDAAACPVHTGASMAGSSERCAHCRAPVVRGDVFCCAGCRSAHALLSQAGLTRYYEIGSGLGASTRSTAARYSVSATAGTAEATRTPQRSSHPLIFIPILPAPDKAMPAAQR